MCKRLRCNNEEKNKQQAITAGTTIIDTENDAMLREAGYILKDFTELLSSSAENRVAKNAK